MRNVLRCIISKLVICMGINMKVYQKKAACCGCGACMEICPKQAIRMVQDQEGFLYPKVEKSRCIHCGKCGEICPMRKKGKISDENLYMGAQAKDGQLRYSGSSGGIFSVLAQYILAHQGIVYGAGYDEAMKVIHKGVEDQKRLGQIKRTKYVQSNMEGIYGRIEKNLKENRWVLFCGTPCQAEALMKYLDQSYEKLLVVDLVCYGVPSPGIWKDYVTYLEQIHKGKMTDFSFRDKRNRDNGHIRSCIIGGKEYAVSLYQDLYCRMYFKNYILRPSCHACRFCTVDRRSDLTIGDFWGIENVRREMDDGMGTSMIIVRSEKAKRIWKEIEQDLIWFSCDKADVLQPRLQQPTDMARGRYAFMLLYRMLPFGLLAGLLEGRHMFQRKTK